MKVNVVISILYLLKVTFLNKALEADHMAPKYPGIYPGIAGSPTVKPGYIKIRQEHFISYSSLFLSQNM